MTLVLWGTVPASYGEESGEEKVGSTGPLHFSLPSEPGTGMQDAPASLSWGLSWGYRGSHTPRGCVLPLPQALITLQQPGAQDRSGLREIYCSDKAI